jgi:hypothetical protein
MLSPTNRSGRFGAKESTVYATHKIKAAGATLTVGFLLATAFTATALAGTGTTQEQQAVRARAVAMNRFYNLGAYSSSSPAVRQADLRRSEAINRFYRTGSYAVISTSSGFDWADAGIGAGVMLGLIVLAGGLTVATRRRTVREPSSPRTT